MGHPRAYRRVQSWPPAATHSVLVSVLLPVPEKREKGEPRTHFMLISTIKAKEKPENADAGLAIIDVNGEEFIFCPVRQKAYKVNAKPEEKVRFWWLYRLKHEYGYSFDQIAVEVPVKVGSTEAKKKADIVVYTDASQKTARIFIEVKKPNRKDGLDQLRVYMNATGCRLGVWSNGAPPHSYLLRIEPTEAKEEPDWRELRNIPRRTEKLDDVDSPVSTRIHGLTTRSPNLHMVREKPGV